MGTKGFPTRGVFGGPPEAWGGAGEGHPGHAPDPIPEQMVNAGMSGLRPTYGIAV